MCIKGIQYLLEIVYKSENMKKIIFLFSCTFYLFANSENIYIDSDLDGVVDIYDKCLNTSFEFEVDKYGCSIEKEDSFKKLISYSFERYHYDSDEIDYKYNINKLAFYLYNNEYLFGISQNFLNLDYKYESLDTIYDYNSDGYGDLTLKFGYFFRYNYLESINLIANLNTSDDESLSSNTNIYTFEFNFGKDIENLNLYSSISYNIFENSDYDNYFDLELGMMKYSKDLYYGVSIYYSEAISDSSNELLLIQPSISIPFWDDYQLGLSYSTNLNNYGSNRRDSFTFKISYCF